MDELPTAPPSTAATIVGFQTVQILLRDLPRLHEMVQYMIGTSMTEYLTLSKHAAVPLWNDSTGPMRRKILEAVQGIDWNAIDILRCGSADSNDRHLLRPVILFVSVEPESTSWLNRRAVVLKCRDVLRKYGINDVEVEIKESRITQCCSSDQDQTEN